MQGLLGANDLAAQYLLGQSLAEIDKSNRHGTRFRHERPRPEGGFLRAGLLDLWDATKWMRSPQEFNSALGNFADVAAADTRGIAGDVLEITGAPKSLYGPGTFYPTSEDYLQAAGGDRWSPSGVAGMLAMPGPAELKGLIGGAKTAAESLGLAGLLGHTLFHGTPHKFDKFDLSKIGTGEGAQAYGHGLYFAENPGVAKSYVGPGGKRPLRADAVQRLIDDEGSVDAARGVLRRQYNEAVRNNNVPRIETLKEDMRILDDGSYKGHLYEVEIPDEITAKMLDWDAPLSEQPALRQAIEADPAAARRLRMAESSFGELSGNQAYEILAQLPSDGMSRDQAFASNWLREAGIPGIRFYDGASRGKVLSRSEFNNQFDIHTDLRGRKTGKSAENYESIMRDGFRQGTMNRITANAAEAPGMAGQFSPKAGDYVYLIPHSTKGKTVAGRPMMPKGWKPGGDDGGVMVQLQEGETLYDAYVRKVGGTRNIVVFNPDDITQVKRDGELVYEAAKPTTSGVGAAARAADDDYIQVYHGTTTDNLESVQKSGILASGERGRGATFASPRPDTAFAYIERGGEKSLKGRNIVPTVPDEDRALVTLRIPKSWWQKHAVQERHGGITPEVGFDETIPPEFVHEVIVGDRKAVYKMPTTEMPGIAPKQYGEVPTKPTTSGKRGLL